MPAVTSAQVKARWTLHHLVPLAVLAVFVAVALGAFFVTRRLVDDQEQQLLDERRAEIALLVQSSINGLDSSLGLLADVGAAGASSPGLFERGANPMVSGTTTGVGAAAADASGELRVVGGAGDADATVGAPLPADIAPAAERALAEGGLVADVSAIAGEPQLVVAVPAASGLPAVAYQRSSIDRTPIRAPGDSTFGGVRVVLFAGPTADPSLVVLTTEEPDASFGGTTSQILTIGGDEWLLVVGSRSPLVGSFVQFAPWLLLGGGIVAAFLAAAVAEMMSRRRDDVLALVDERTRELRVAHDELDATRTFLERVLDVGPVVVARSPFPFGQLSYVSSNVERLFGHSVDDALALGFLAEHVHPDDAPALEAALDRLADPQSRQSSADVRLRRADGVDRWVTIAFVAERADAGGAGSVVAYILDIDDRRRLEEAQRSAQESAEAANRSKNEFLSRMSHELRTPLNAVIGFAQLLEMDDLTVNQRDSVRQIERGGEHLLELINEVLDIARIETGRLRLSVEPVRLDDAVNESIDLVRPLARARGISFPYRLPAPCHRHVSGDRQRLKQVLLNLLGNAVKYNHDHGRVELSCAVQPNGRVRVSVTDTGPGIAPEKLDMVFTPFERLGAETTTVEGTGLGLALARGLAHAMGGELGVDSELGVGSTFWIELEPAEAPAEAIDVAQAPAATSDAAGARTVLYVEDNISNVRLVERIMSHRPHVRTIVAMQGQLGIELARQHRPDLVLLDLNLPDMDGEEVLARLKAEPSLRDVPIVIVSADATAKQVARLRASGAADYLTKPLDIAAFLAMIDAYLGRPSVAAPERPPAPQHRDERSGRLDPDVLRGLQELVGDGAGLEDLASTFVEESTARLESLRRAVEGPDSATVHDLAHSLKGIAGTFGDVATMRLCTTMQEHAAIGDPELLRQLTDDLAVTLRRSYRDLDRYLASQVS